MYGVIKPIFSQIYAFMSKPPLLSNEFFIAFFNASKPFQANWGPGRGGGGALSRGISWTNQGILKGGVSLYR